MTQCNDCGDDLSGAVIHQQWHCIASLKTRLAAANERAGALADADREVAKLEERTGLTIQQMADKLADAERRLAEATAVIDALRSEVNLDGFVWTHTRTALALKRYIANTSAGPSGGEKT